MEVTKVEVKDLGVKQGENDKPMDAIMRYKDFAIECFANEDGLFKFRFVNGLFKGMEYSIDEESVNVLPDVDNPKEKVLEMKINIINRQAWYKMVEELIYQIASSDILMRTEKYLKDAKKEDEQKEKDGHSTSDS